MRGRALSARDGEELTTLTTDYTTTSAPSLGAIVPPTGGPFFSLHGAHAAWPSPAWATTVSRGHFRWRRGHRAHERHHGEQRQVRVLADLTRVFAVLPKPGPAPRVAAHPHQCHHGAPCPTYYTITPEDNKPPSCPTSTCTSLLPLHRQQRVSHPHPDHGRGPEWRPTRSHVHNSGAVRLRLPSTAAHPATTRRSCATTTTTTMSGSAGHIYSRGMSTTRSPTQ